MTRSDKDVTKAAEHGTVTVLFPGHRPSMWSPDFVAAALEQLERHQYDPAVDLLLMAGNIVPIVLLAAAVARECETGPKFLFFDAARQDYVVVPLPELKEAGHHG